jgi:hypothetical protein
MKRVLKWAIPLLLLLVLDEGHRVHRRLQRCAGTE